MKYGRPLSAAAAALLVAHAPAHAHRLDEYLQATVIDVTRRHVAITVDLTPGVDIAPGVIRAIDRNEDGVLSQQEWQAYATHVAQGLSLSLDGTPLPLVSVTTAFPPVAAMRAGSGTIRLHLGATVALTPGAHRLAYTNHGTGPDTVYLVNALLPRDPTIHAQHQQRTTSQTSYELDFTVTPRDSK
ncbi:hypothetical protein [Komagataeibacter oboediens]|uniref:EF-hand domain-containing protein n=1 Tax=Komagataeibacter oboediens TaxID=65958 RepID=A0ABS5SR82_9PROT|nr:hypothetical protein [Komagataeibacter oboediens]MBL7233213.1 hypothetical protein [Komagataeibacter oboediens]MBT0676743.1 hypothetical protein [Komagataeibacter oboediens]MBT0680014.1 hypothetical protein [Komagataeibacter oboediens]